MTHNSRIKGEVRRAQLISTFGVGAMIAAGDESFMVCVTDDWPIGSQDWQHDVESLIVREPRLERRLQVKYFLLPPSGDEEGSQDVPVVRFPEYHYCPSCRKLDHHSRLAAKPGSNQCSRCGVELVPSRFVIACRNGHIGDFPYSQWLHARGQGGSANCAEKHKMTLDTTGESASLGSIVIKCGACGMRASLEGAFGKDSLKSVVGRCFGKRPWIGAEEEGCTETPQVLQRGASNVWFPMVASAVSIPPWSDRAVKVVLRHWDTSIQSIVTIVPEEQWPALLSGLASTNGIEVDALIAAIKRKMSFDGEAVSPDEDLRAGEYEALKRGTAAGNASDDFSCESRSFSGPGERGHFTSVSSVHRLREVRALTKFTRLAPPLGTYDKGQPVAMRRGEWLPAVEVRGEGVFLEFSSERLARWESQQSVRRRAAVIAANYAAAMKGRGAEPQREITPRFVMIHTFAHALINQWALDSGYPAAELRERLYADDGMSGVLIYTASGDSAGSLGGVVSQARQGTLERGIEEAIQRAAWCSADPLCVESEAQGVDSLNLAACHSCALLPEVSCEEGNRLLDRALLVGTPEDATLGFFEELI